MLWDPFSVQQTTAGKKDLIDPGSREMTNIEGALRMNEWMNERMNDNLNFYLYTVSTKNKSALQ